MIDFVLGEHFCSSRAVPSPLRSGMLMSRMATSGLTSGICWRASLPLEASPAIWNPSLSSRALRPWRTSAWSSTRKTRIGIVTPPVLDSWNSCTWRAALRKKLSMTSDWARLIARRTGESVSRSPIRRQADIAPPEGGLPYGARGKQFHQAGPTPSAAKLQ